MDNTYPTGQDQEPIETEGMKAPHPENKEDYAGMFKPGDKVEATADGRYNPYKKGDTGVVTELHMAEVLFGAPVPYVMVAWDNGLPSKEPVAKRKLRKLG